MTQGRITGSQPRRAPLAPRIRRDKLRSPILEALARHATVGLFLSDPHGGAYYFNREACRIMGLPRTRALDLGWIKALHPEDRARFLRRRAHAVARGAVFRGRVRFLHGDGCVVVADVVSVPFRDRGRLRIRVGMLMEVTEETSPTSGDPEGTSGRRWDDLSPQERRVLQLLVEGKTNKAIGAALGLSDKTVKNYLSSVFQKLHVTRRSQAAALFARRASDR